MSTILERIEACADGSVIMLDSDVEEAIVTPEGRNFVLDLGGHTLTAPAGSTPLKILGSKVIVRNGTIKATGGAIAVRVGSEGAEVHSFARLENTLTIVSADCVGLFVSRNAEVESSADIYTEGGEYAAISGNGSEPHWNNKLTIYDGNITSHDVAIYWPQVGDLKIMGGTITGTTGIEIRAGGLYVQGGTIIGTGVPTSVTPNGNGSTSVGCGVAIAQHTTKKAIDVTLTGGTIKGYSAVYESNPQKNPAESIALVTPNIYKGKFEAINGGTVAVYSEDCTGFVRGGVFNVAVDKTLCTDGFEVIQQPDGSFASKPVAWEFPDGGVVGGGMMNMRRLALVRERYDYPAGGIPVPDMGFIPFAVLSVSAKGGLTSYLDPETNKVVLYKGTKEASGTLENLKLILIGY